MFRLTLLETVKVEHFSMNKYNLSSRRVAITIITLLVGIVESSPTEKTKEGKPFSLIVLPDTQYYSRGHSELFMGQTKWIRNQKEELNIACVVHEGDLTDQNSAAEWKVADEAMALLVGVAPYCVVLGNHDIDPHYSDIVNRNYASFNAWFGPQRFEKESWYGGHLGDGNENAYYYFNASGMDFMVLCLEFGPTDEVLAWADKIVENHPDHRIIVVTHSYTHFDDTRVGRGDPWNPKAYGLTDANDGEDMWDKFVRKHQNIFLVLSGHVLGDGLGYLASTGDHGNTVHQILANYQMQELGGNGWLRIMEFQPAQNKIVIRTYSPNLDQYNDDPQNKFEMNYTMVPLW